VVSVAGEVFRRIALALLSLVLGGAVAAGLLVYAGTAGGGRVVYAVARDLPAGAPLTADTLVEVRASLDPAQGQSVFTPADRGRLLASRARHPLGAGQLIQRSDVQPAGGDVADALVTVPVKFLPPAHAGDRVDLFILSGAGDQTVAEPFAWGVPVAAVLPDALVLQVRGGQEEAYVYAAGVLRLAAVVTTAPVPPDGAGPIDSQEAAVAAAAG
jgi:hypothetical protein